jgi:hypothetical protein
MEKFPPNYPFPQGNTPRNPRMELQSSIRAASSKGSAIVTKNCLRRNVPNKLKRKDW